MKIICITGATSGVGKTRLAEMFLSHLDNWAACKVTTCIGGVALRCPRGRKSCGVCSSLKKDYEIEEETVPVKSSAAVPFPPPKIWRVCLGHDTAHSKDTQRLLRAGAKAVFWIKTKPKFLKKSVGIAIKRLRKYRGIIFEGNHVLEVLNPDVAIMIMSKDGKIKKSAKEVMDKVDIFILLRRKLRTQVRR